MRKVIFICVTVLVLNSASVFASGSKKPTRPGWPVPPVTAEIAPEAAE